MADRRQRPDLPDDLFDLPLDGEDPGSAAGAPRAPAVDEVAASEEPEGAGGQNLPLFEPVEEHAAPEPAPPESSEPSAPVDLPSEPRGDAQPARHGGLFDGGWSGGAAEEADAAAPTEAGSWDHSWQELEEGQEAPFEDDYDAEAAPLLSRLQAGSADLLVHVAVIAGCLIAMNLLGLRAEWSQWPGFVAFLILFSFLYLAFPLAFWGQTPGMAWFRLRAREDSDRPLAFGQTGLRVVGTWLTFLLAGLPTLLALLDGRSLVDRLSGSLTLVD